MKTVLSTKRLTLPQKELLLNAHFGLVEYNAIVVEKLMFQMPQQVPNAIFTSQNSARFFLESEHEKPTIGRIFCVGQKTRSVLEKNGLKVGFFDENAAKLGQFIVKTFQNEEFYFFCGNQRLDTLPKMLNHSKNTLFEVKTYKIEAKTRKFDQKFDGVMFFSPSGVRSFFSVNSIAETSAFCIGETTASEVKKHASTVYVSNSSSVESVIAKTVKTLKSA